MLSRCAISSTETQHPLQSEMPLTTTSSGWRRCGQCPGGDAIAPLHTKACCHLAQPLCFCASRSLRPLPHLPALLLQTPSALLLPLPAEHGARLLVWVRFVCHCSATAAD